MAAASLTTAMRQRNLRRRSTAPWPRLTNSSRFVAPPPTAARPPPCHSPAWPGTVPPPRPSRSSVARRARAHASAATGAPPACRTPALRARTAPPHTGRRRRTACRARAARSARPQRRRPRGALRASIRTGRARPTARRAPRIPSAWATARSRRRRRRAAAATTSTARAASSAAWATRVTASRCSHALLARTRLSSASRDAPSVPPAPL